MRASQYDTLEAKELALLIEGLRTLESEGLRKTAQEQSFILRNISREKLCEVVRLLNQRGGLAAVLSGKIEGR